MSPAPRLSPTGIACALAMVAAPLPAIAQSLLESIEFNTVLGYARHGAGMGLTLARGGERAWCVSRPDCLPRHQPITLGSVETAWPLGSFASRRLMTSGGEPFGAGQGMRGVSLSLVGRMPLSDMFSAYGKVGSTYGHGGVATLANPGFTSGGASGFGLSFGAGLSWRFSPRLSAMVEWDSIDFRIGGGRDPVHATSLGLRFQY